VELGPDLVQLAEQLPVSEEHGLNHQLHLVAVDLPAAIAYDLLESDSYTRKLHIARLAAMLDIIDKVYPALDTGEARKKLEKLADRVGSSDSFGEQTPGAAKAYLPGAKVNSGPAGTGTKPAPLPRPVPSPVPDPASVKVVPDDSNADPTAAAALDPAAEAPAPTKIQVTPGGEVQPAATRPAGDES
jgi:hypothetical protein